MTLKKTDPVVSVRMKVTAKELDFEVFALHFQEFFNDTPWNEHLMCPKCKSPDDFGPSYTWGITSEIDHCPSCHSGLELFWSLDRTSRYLNQHNNAFGVVVTLDEKPVAWAWGYPIDSFVYYLDTVAILPEAKKFPGTRFVMSNFRNFLKEISNEGFSQVKSRTHKDALKVKQFMRFLGFSEGEDSDDPERHYWRLILKKDTSS